MSAQESFKSQLEKCARKHGMAPPVYTTHDVYMGWESTLVINGHVFNLTSMAGTKRSIEERISKNALDALRISGAFDASRINSTGDKRIRLGSRLKTLIIFDSKLEDECVKDFISKTKWGSNVLVVVLGSDQSKEIKSECVCTTVPSDDLWYTYLVMIVTESVIKNTVDRVVIVSERDEVNYLIDASTNLFTGLSSTVPHRPAMRVLRDVKNAQGDHLTTQIISLLS